MVEYYFDMETTGLDPEQHKIISIQIQRLAGNTGEPIDELKILKEWESSEKEIIEKVMPLVTCENPFNFIFIGKNLLFDLMFLSGRAEKHGLKGLDLRCIYDRAFIDLKHVLVMINKGRFQNYGKLLREGSITNKQLHQLYKQGKYDEIINYIKEETDIFLKAYRKLRKKMPTLVKVL